MPNTLHSTILTIQPSCLKQDWTLATENNDIALLLTIFFGLFNKHKALKPLITTEIKTPVKTLGEIV